MLMFASCFVLAIVSALLPWVNAELMLLAAASPATSIGEVVVLVVAATAGQVTGKSALYWIARRTLSPGGRIHAAVARWREACEHRQRSTRATMMLSAVAGVPPFYVTTLAAGALGIDFVSFLTSAVVGRLVHFSAVALAPLAIHAVYR